MVRLVVTGVCGRMGRAILDLAAKDPAFELVGAVEAKDHPQAGKAIGTAGPLVIDDDLTRIIARADVLIDFTEASSCLGNFRIARDAGKAVVIGTTGLGEAALAEIGEGGRRVQVVMSPNMSIGMNVMFDVAGRVAGILREGYDVEILEMHHRLKKDAPSGTALKLKEIVESAVPEKKWVETFGRKGMTGERKPEEIGVLALRGGDVVGEHTVMFAGLGERFEITHRAYSRDNFARGALLAARWAVAQKNGLYSMRDVLGL
jgi:4-hydroxy-tetrahydrodipicolinate reductase